MTIEQLAKQIFDECAKDGEPVTEAEALEMAQMEIDAKGVSREAKALEPKKKSENKPKVVKVSPEKAELFDFLWEGISNYYENAEIVKNNKEIAVKIGDVALKIDIVEHRKAK